MFAELDRPTDRQSSRLVEASLVEPTIAEDPAPVASASRDCPSRVDKHQSSRWRETSGAWPWTLGMSSHGAPHCTVPWPWNSARGREKGRGVPGSERGKFIAACIAARGPARDDGKGRPPPFSPLAVHNPIRCPSAGNNQVPVGKKTVRTTRSFSARQHVLRPRPNRRQPDRSRLYLLFQLAFSVRHNAGCRTLREGIQKQAYPDRRVCHQLASRMLANQTAPERHAAQTESNGWGGGIFQKTTHPPRAVPRSTVLPRASSTDRLPRQDHWPLVPCLPLSRRTARQTCGREQRRHQKWTAPSSRTVWRDTARFRATFRSSGSSLAPGCG